MHTGKLFGMVLLTAVLIQVIAFSGMGFFSNIQIPFADVIALTLEMVLLILALILGSSLFAEEKAQNSFEYLFSLRFSRWQILKNKLIPRTSFFLAGFLLYLVLLSVVDANRLFLPAGMFLSIYFSLFLFSTSLALLHRNNVLNMISSFSLLVVVWGFSLFILNFLFTSFNTFNYDDVMFRMRLGGAAMVITLVVSVGIFVSFFFHFRRVDLSNLFKLFFKRYLLWVLIIVSGLLIVYVAINQIDVSANADAFTSKDLRPATFDRSNGFYRLNSLLEPPEVDVESEKIHLKYRRYHDPQYDNDKYVKNFDRLSFAPFQTNRKKWDYFPHEHNSRSWAMEVVKKREVIVYFKDKWAVLLQRYQKLMEADVFEDFTRINWDSPVPNLLGWLRVGKLYLAVNMLDALEGNWQQGVANILQHIRFGKRSIRGSRVVIYNLIAKAILKLSLKSLASLMSHPDCPKEVYQQVIAGLPAIKYEEFGSENCFIGEYLAMEQFLDQGIYTRYTRFNERVLVKLFYQRNRTLRLVDHYVKSVIKLEKTVPHKMEKGLAPGGEEAGTLLSGWFWWLQNPVGKMILMDYVIANYKSMIMKSYHAKCLYDMTRITAEFYLNYDGSMPAEKVLKELEIYQELLDPCSNKPYVFNQKKQILYSIGTDLDDDGGKGDPITSLNTDFVLPLRVKR